MSHPEQFPTKLLRICLWLTRHRQLLPLLGLTTALLAQPSALEATTIDFPGNTQAFVSMASPAKGDIALAADPSTPNIPNSPTATEPRPSTSKEPNPLESLARTLGIPAGLIGGCALVWFLFLQGKPLLENKKAWKELTQGKKDPDAPGLPSAALFPANQSVEVKGTGNTTLTEVSATRDVIVNQTIHQYSQPEPSTSQQERAVRVEFAEGASENKIIKPDSIRLSSTEYVEFIITCHFRLYTVAPIQIVDIQLYYPEIEATPGQHQLRADNIKYQFTANYCLKEHFHVTTASDIVMDRTFMCKSYLLDLNEGQNLYRTIQIQIKYVTIGSSRPEVLNVLGKLEPGGRVVLVRYKIEEVIDGGEF